MRHETQEYREAVAEERGRRKVEPQQREWVELVTGERFWSDDHWVSAWKLIADGYGRAVKGKELDRVRFIAIVQHGGGRDD